MDKKETTKKINRIIETLLSYDISKKEAAKALYDLFESSTLKVSMDLYDSNDKYLITVVAHKEIDAKVILIAEKYEKYDSIDWNKSKLKVE